MGKLPARNGSQENGAKDMKQIHSLIAIGMLALHPLVALPAKAEDLNATFHQLENAFARGYQEKNASVLETMLAPEYALVVSARPDAPISRAQWLALLPDYNVRSFTIRGLHVRCLQASPAGRCALAAVSSINTQDADVAGEDRSGEFFIVDIWSRRDGRWVVATRYSGRTEAALPRRMDE